MNSDTMTVRTKVAVELGIIAVLTIAFLLLFPHRNPWFDVGLTGFALLCIGASAGYTKNVVWAASPPQPGRNRFNQCVKITLWVTVPTVVGFLLVGAIAFYGSYLIGANDFWLSFLLLIIAGTAMYAPYGPFFAMITELLPSNVAGGAIALINSLGALGSFAGAFLVGYLNGATGGFGASYLFMSGSLLLSAILTMVAVKN